MNSKKIRCFIALELPSEIKQFAQKTQQEIKDRNLVDARYTDRNSLHLTLKFLGEIDEETVKYVSEKLSRIKFPKFHVSLERTGTFLQEGETKIIWHALKSEELNKLQKIIDEELKERFIPEKRFMGHITIARVKRDLQQGKLIAFLDSVSSDHKTYKITKFCFIKSTPTSEGSLYETLEEYSLE